MFLSNAVCISSHRPLVKPLITVTFLNSYTLILRSFPFFFHFSPFSGSFITLLSSGEREAIPDDTHVRMHSQEAPLNIHSDVVRGRHLHTGSIVVLAVQISDDEKSYHRAEVAV